MGGLVIHMMYYAIIVGGISTVAYFVIKSAVKAALREYHNENMK